MVTRALAISGQVMRILAAMLLMIGAMSVSTGQPARGDSVNLVADPGFEQQPGGGIASPWACHGNCGADVGLGYARTGRANGFVRFDAGWNAVYQSVSVAPNTTYRLTAWLRTSDNNTDGYVGARGTSGGLVRNEDKFGAIGEWKEFSIVVDSGDATELDIFAGLWASGDTWLQADDFSLVALGSNQLGPGTQLYPRLIRLAHSGAANGQLIASTTSFDPNGLGAIYRSTDDGATFSRIGTVRDPLSARGQCCASIYELPQAIGNMPEGTLLFAASYAQDARPMSINLWFSTDHGVTWTKRSTVVTAPDSGGLWEPEMHVNTQGELTLYYADETQQPAHSQTIMEVFSADGNSWSTPYPVVSLGDSGARPGMPIVRVLANGTRFMSYEICGSSYGCEVYYRTSADGADWGDPATSGRRIVASDGTRFRHTPTITVIRDGSATGKLVLGGQLYVNSAGEIDGGNGIILLTNTSGGSGGWTRIVAPVRVPDAYDNYCPNYSPALAPTADNAHVIEISTMYSGTTCIARFATGRV